MKAEAFDRSFIFFQYLHLKDNEKWKIFYSDFYQEDRTTGPKEQAKKYWKKPDILSLIENDEVHCKVLKELPKAIPKH